MQTMLRDGRKLGVIIADDEPLICDLLKSLIQWEELDLVLLSVANNGGELMGQLCDNKPDIVITDICMPEMNGIDLIQQAREKGLSCRFIIVSGYRQFEYAHKALRYDVENYLLKPIDGEELNECIRKTAQSIRSSAVPLPGQQAGFSHLLMDHILNSAGHPEQLDIERINREFGTRFQEGCFRFATVRLDMHGDGEDMAINALTLTEKIARAMAQCLDAHTHQILYRCKIDSISILANYAPDADGAARHALAEGFNIGMNFTDLFVGLKMAMGVSERFVHLAACARASEQARWALWCRILQSGAQIVSFADLSLREEDLVCADLTEYRQKLTNALTNLDEDAFSQTAAEIIADMTSAKRAVQIAILLRDLCGPFAAKISAMLEEENNEQYLYAEFVHGLDCAYSAETLQRLYFAPIRKFIRDLRARADQRAQKPIRQAVAYMQENYSQPLKLDDVAAQVFLSPHYFSGLFIAEMGQSFSDCLIGIRLEAAKKFLKETNLSIREIASRVGYADSRYFSRLFMQKMHIKPKEFRKIYG